MIRKVYKFEGTDITVEVSEDVNVTSAKFILDKYEPVSSCSIMANLFSCKFKTPAMVSTESNAHGTLIRVKADGFTEVKLSISDKGGCRIYTFNHNGTKKTIMECPVADGILLYNQNGKSTYIHKDGTHEVQEMF